MKKLIAASVIVLSINAIAQENTISSGNNNPMEDRINKLEDHNKALNIYFNFQSSFDVVNDNISNETNVGFKARQLRLEIKGDLTDKIFYRFRHRLNKATDAKSLDNLAKATDLMYAGYHVNDQFTVIAGKQCQTWGGFEFDTNPMNIYEYSDFIENMDNFMLGANFIYTPNKNHEFNVQITDSRNKKFDDEYGDLSAQNITASTSPLTYIVNWNGNFLDGKLQTRWAYGIQTEAKNKYSKMITLGQKLNLEKFQLAFDYMRANEDLDRLQIASSEAAPYLTPNNLKFFENVTYNTFILRADFPVTPQINIFGLGRYETSSVDKIDALKNDFRKVYHYTGGLEYSPFQDQDLKLFAAYVGKSVKFSDQLNLLKDYNSNRFSIGLMYRIKAY